MRLGPHRFLTSGGPAREPPAGCGGASLVPSQLAAYDRDAFGATTRERALEIMRDHAVGAYGTVAVVLDLGLKATALAVLWKQQGHRAEAHSLLAPVCNWFSEGSGTADVKDANAQLAELA